MRALFNQAPLLILTVLLIAFPLITKAAEAPGALTFIVKDQNTDRPLSTAIITITERATSSTRSVATDDQGRIVVENLDPGLYSVGVAKDGFASLYEPSVRVVTRKNTKLELELSRP
ncbi:carboxypeptidase-like regulatory domain-containing protein [Algiphilus aromaticivorans]|uniref:carboxypeptidase-like regulatory domain-containing protein n=1 Tax=Algiphilus aromaticivorans TaxID=382454 RepID=UPI0005C25177|nr:carboxypeptidase-like regulatory domain-containing protein [Algiphilus aromaticivorans]